MNMRTATRSMLKDQCFKAVTAANPDAPRKVRRAMALERLREITKRVGKQEAQ